MGQISSKDKNCQDSNHAIDFNLQKISKIKYNQFGQICIYQQNVKPYHYMMKYTEYGMGNIEYLHYLKYILLNIPSHRNMVRVEHALLRNNRQLCGTTMKLNIYVRYYNHTLYDTIKLCQKKNYHLRQKQLIYILNSLVSLGNYYNQSSNEYTGIFKTEKIYLSPQGYIKIYPLEKQWIPVLATSITSQKQKSIDEEYQTYQNKLSLSNHHNRNNNSNNNNFDKNIYDSELINDNQYAFSFRNKSFSEYSTPNNEYFIPINNLSQQKNDNQKDKSNDIQELGIMMLELIFLNDHKYYYQKDTGLPKWDLIQFMANKMLFNCNFTNQLQNIIHKLIDYKNPIKTYSQIEKLTKSTNKLYTIENISCIRFDQFFQIPQQNDNRIQNQNNTSLEIIKQKKLRNYNWKKKLIPRHIKIISMQNTGFKK